MIDKNLRILVVDDYESARSMLKIVLTSMGFHQVEEAVNGSTAIKQLETADETGKPFDLVISDWHMPTLSGFDFLKLCRSNPKLKDLPFIMVSAESETESIVEALRAGANDFINKPFRKEALIEKITRAVAHKVKAA